MTKDENIFCNINKTQTKVKIENKEYIKATKKRYYSHCNKKEKTVHKWCTVSPFYQSKPT